ncbi:MAG: hypothetical protein IT215_02290 [Chitinophagaceae bacterium]|nr:hypothetical protein [Chitinophagaceae bacterium]
MKPELNNRSNLVEENICIPGDLLIEILGIIVRENLPHEITQVSENKSLVFVSLYINKSDMRHTKLIQNIHRLLTEYKEFRWEESEQFNWRES